MIINDFFGEKMKDDIYKNIIKNIKNCLPLNLSRYSVHEPNISLSVKNELNKCLKSTFVSSEGEYIDKLSDKLRKITGSRYILLTSSGTSALFCALNEINILNQDVIVPSMTFVATANSVINAGGTPVLIESSKSNLNIDHNDLKK